MTATVVQCSESQSQETAVLFLSLELSKKAWIVSFAVSVQSGIRKRTVAGGSLAVLLLEISLAKRAMKLPDEARVVACYEAGRDGFWLQRALVAAGIECRVLESASLEVDRRAKRAKTDRLDGERLVRALMRFEHGDVQACRVIRPPAAEDEDARQLPRELQALRDERTRHSNRIKALLFAQGVRCEEITASFLGALPRMKTGDGRELPERLRARLTRDFARLQLCVEQIRALEEERNALFREAEQHLEQAARRDELAVRLFALRGLGDECAWTFSLELFSWRNFRNRREVGAVLGLTPLPFSSGNYHSDQGLSKTGRSRLRSLCIELAWLWLRYQPESALSQWYEQRFASGSRRVRRIGIVALARKLMVALWKYLEEGELPRGAVLKTDCQANAHRLTPLLARRAKSIPPPRWDGEAKTRKRSMT